MFNNTKTLSAAYNALTLFSGALILFGVAALTWVLLVHDVKLNMLEITVQTMTLQRRLEIVHQVDKVLHRADRHPENSKGNRLAQEAHQLIFDADGLMVQDDVITAMRMYEQARNTAELAENQLDCGQATCEK